MMNGTEWESDEQAEAVSATNALNLEILRYFSQIIIPFGLIQNSISFLIFRRSVFYSTAMGNLYSWQIAVDIVMLTVSFLLVGAPYLFGSPFDLISDFCCAMFNFLLTFGIHMSSGANMLITLDRFVRIRCQKKFAWTKSGRCVGAAILFLALFLFLVDMDLLLFRIRPVGVSTGVNSTQAACLPVADWHAALVDIKSIMFRSLLPVAIILTLNPMVLGYIKEREAEKDSAASNEELLFTNVLIGINWGFVIHNTPFIIVSIISIFFKHLGLSLSALQLAIIDLWQTITLVFASLYPGSSLVLHIQNNSLYRAEIKTILGLRSRSPVSFA
nr:G protein-coupled receptor [Proales similis]